MFKKIKIYLLILIVLLIPVSSIADNSSTLIFVLDTGLNYEKIEMPSIKPLRWLNLANNSYDISDPIGHGTNITLLIQQTYKKANIIPIKIINKDHKAPCSNILKSLYVINQIKEDGLYKDRNFIINLSFSTLKDDYVNLWTIERFYMILQQLNKNNILLVSAAGNENINVDKEKIIPSMLNYDNHITVASLNKNSELCNFSNYGNSVDVFIIGERIPLKINNKMYLLNGTSYSTAIISAYCAELWDKYPELTVKEIKNQIELLYNIS